MPTRKIADIVRPCLSPDHNPPTHMYYPDGVYEHVCSQCGARIVFTVRSPYYIERPSPVIYEWVPHPWQSPIWCGRNTGDVPYPKFGSFI